MSVEEIKRAVKSFDFLNLEMAMPETTVDIEEEASNPEEP